jgi:hypothetical protein
MGRCNDHRENRNHGRMILWLANDRNGWKADARNWRAWTQAVIRRNVE